MYSSVFTCKGVSSSDAGIGCNTASGKSRKMEFGSGFTSDITSFESTEISSPYVELLWFIPLKWKSSQAPQLDTFNNFCSPRISLDCIDLHYRTEQKTTGGKFEKECLIYNRVKVLKVLVALPYLAWSSSGINEEPAIISMHKNVLNFLSGFYG